jgi:acid phosphatase
MVALPEVSPNDARMPAMRMKSLLSSLAIAAALFASMSQTGSAAALGDINHIIVIYLENRAFDNLYGAFPGADGRANAGAAATQVDRDGKPYATLPQPVDTNQKPAAPDPHFPANLPNQPFQIDQYMAIDQITGDLVHRFWHEQMQIDGGKMDKFVAYSDSAGLAMGFYDGSKMKLWDWAKRYTLADRFFHSAFGGSFLNHFHLICACAPRFENAPASLVAKLDAAGNLVMPGADQITPDGYAVNTMQPLNPPFSPSATDPAKRLPVQDMKTIGDELSEKGIDWAWYSGGWNDAAAGHPDKLFQFHHQPFVYFKNYAPGTDARAKHLKDEVDLEKAIADGSLPAVVFYKPIGTLNEHPGYSEIMAGDAHIDDLLTKMEKSPVWKDSVIVITYDEHGGYWDHVPPPKRDRWGPGLRVPTLIISPFAKRGYVDHTAYDTTSILRLIEQRFGVAPLGDSDRNAGDLTNALNLQ